MQPSPLMLLATLLATAALTSPNEADFSQSYRVWVSADRRSCTYSLTDTGLNPRQLTDALTQNGYEVGRGAEVLTTPDTPVRCVRELRVPFGEPVLSPFAQGLGLRRIGCTAFRERQLCAGFRPKAGRRLSSPSRPFVMQKSKVLHQRQRKAAGRLPPRPCRSEAYGSIPKAAARSSQKGFPIGKRR